MARIEGRYGRVKLTNRAFQTLFEQEIEAKEEFSLTDLVKQIDEILKEDSLGCWTLEIHQGFRNGDKEDEQIMSFCRSDDRVVWKEPNDIKQSLVEILSMYLTQPCLGNTD